MSGEIGIAIKTGVLYMILHFVSLIALVSSIISFIVLLPVWTYSDAKERGSSNPVFWTIIVAIGCFPVGLVIYLLAGRNNKDVQTSKKYKKALIISFFCIIPAIVFFIVGIVTLGIARDSEGFYLQSGQFRTLSRNVYEQEWVVSASSADGFVRRNFDLSESDLANMTVFIRIYGGIVGLTFEQIESGIVEIFPISNEPDTRINIDTTQFEPGVIRKTLYFLEVTDVEVTISWGVGE